jgi:hypothetical protein
MTKYNRDILIEYVKIVLTIIGVVLFFMLKRKYIT